MAFVFTNAITGQKSAGGASSLVLTASITPAAGELFLCLVLIQNAASLNPSVSGAGVTWAQVGSKLTCNGGLNTLCLFRAMGSGSAGQVTISAGGGTGSIMGQVTKVTGCDTSGTNGSGAIVQSASANTGGPNPFTVTLSAFASASNAGFAIFGCENTAYTAPATYTSINQFTGSGGDPDILAEFKLNSTAMTASGGAFTNSYGGIAVELAIAPVVTGTSGFFHM